MKATKGQKRLYDTLVAVLDSLRKETPTANTYYHPPASNPDALIQARSKALLHLYLKARFGITSFTERVGRVGSACFVGCDTALTIFRLSASALSD